MAKIIKVSPVELKSAATSIEAQVQDYKNLYQTLFKEVEAMAASGWQGDDSLAFTTQIEGFREDFQQMERLMTEYATFLKQSAQTYSQAQEEITNAARRLTN